MTGKRPFIHHLADVQTEQVGDGTSIWQFVVVLTGARIGSHCNINCHSFIEGDVVIGNNVTVKSGAYLWNGLTVEDDVFIGPNVTFANDPRPRSKKYPDAFQRTVLEKGASIGAAATILGGTTIGTYALVGAASLVTRDVPPFALVKGAPAVICGWVDKAGDKLIRLPSGFWEDKSGATFEVRNDKLVRL
jgi:acetyltransferase-like isoleucine patch superfamily enzyme